MMSLNQIQEMADEQASLAAKNGLVPYVLFDANDVERMPGGTKWNGSRLYPFPNIGSYVPDGWEELDDKRLFVDKTGLGAGNELALSVSQLNRALLSLLQEIDEEVGIAIVEEGQFQMYLGVFRKV